MNRNNYLVTLSHKEMKCIFVTRFVLVPPHAMPPLTRARALQTRGAHLSRLPTNLIKWTLAATRYHDASPQWEDQDSFKIQMMRTTLTAIPHPWQHPMYRRQASVLSPFGAPRFQSCRNPLRSPVQGPRV